VFASREGGAALKELPNRGHSLPRGKLEVRSVDKVVPISSPFEAGYIGQNVRAEVDISLLLFVSCAGEIFPVIEDSNVPGDAEIMIALPALCVCDPRPRLGSPGFMNITGYLLDCAVNLWVL
jgi:hypothetical protein